MRKTCKYHATPYLSPCSIIPPEACNSCAQQSQAICWSVWSTNLGCLTWRSYTAYVTMQHLSQCLLMAYVIDTPSRRLESYKILTPANVGRRLDSFLFDMLADGQPVWWSAVHEMYHPAVCDMMGGPASFVLSILDHWKAVWYAGFQQYIKHIWNLSISVTAATPMICGALNGPSGCLQYDEGTTKHLVQYLTSMESCDVQDSNSTSYIQYV